MRSQTNKLSEQKKKKKKKEFHSSLHSKVIMSYIHVILFFFYWMVVIMVVSNLGLHSGSLNNGNNNKNTTLSLQPEQAYLNRKLFYHGYCTNRDISISQSRGITRGIPQYIVQIVNTCVTGCAPSNIHLHCGWFASARIVNPRTFKRISYDDCLVNGGKPLKTSQIISFTYSNSFMYPIGFKYAKFC